MKDLLIIFCSDLKKKLEGKVKAWDLYDGVVYRVLKKNKIDFEKYDVVIISAKYGLIYPDTAIEYYDQRMNRKRAKELKESISSNLERILKEPYNKIYVCLGKWYLLATGLLDKMDDRIIFLTGGIGIKLGKLKKILEGNFNI